MKECACGCKADYLYIGEYWCKVCMRYMLAIENTSTYIRCRMCDNVYELGKGVKDKACRNFCCAECAITWHGASKLTEDDHE